MMALGMADVVAVIGLSWCYIYRLVSQQIEFSHFYDCCNLIALEEIDVILNRCKVAKPRGDFCESCGWIRGDGQHYNNRRVAEVGHFLLGENILLLELILRKIDVIRHQFLVLADFAVVLLFLLLFAKNSICSRMVLTFPSLTNVNWWRVNDFATRSDNKCKHRQLAPLCWCGHY